MRRGDENDPPGPGSALRAGGHILRYAFNHPFEEQAAYIRLTGPGQEGLGAVSWRNRNAERGHFFT